MMRLLLPLILMLLGTGAGIGAAAFLGGGSAPPPVEAKSMADQEVTAFVAFETEFMVPVMKNDRIVKLMILSLSIEVPDASTTLVRDREPRLRDTFLRVMFDYANAGGFDDGIYSSAGVDQLRRELKESASASLGPVVRDVLIVNLVQQSM
ncbi:MAG: flagellar basal body-associated protein FliL [Qingshengfaniella sp.]